MCKLAIWARIGVALFWALILINLWKPQFGTWSRGASWLGLGVLAVHALEVLVIARRWGDFFGVLVFGMTWPVGRPRRG